MSLVPRDVWGYSPFENRLSTWNRPRGGGGFFDDFATAMMPWGGGFGTMMPSFGGGELSRGVMAPNMLSMDMRENDQAYDIRFDVPGVNKESIRVSVDDQRRTATISTEQKVQKDDEDWGWHARERSYGRAQRTIALPWDCDPNKVDVRCENGVLHMNLPKSETPPGHRITVT